MKMEKVKKLLPLKLSFPSQLRVEKDPNLAFQLFLTPPKPNSHYTLSSYDIIITKLGRAKMFDKMETILHKLKHDKRVIPKEIMFCNIIQYYAKSGQLNNAHHVFDKMLVHFRCPPSIKSFNTLLHSCLLCREFRRIEQLLIDVDNYGVPNVCTFNVVMSVCFSRGRLDKACWDLLVRMQRDGVRPDVVSFGTLVGGFCRSHRLELALKLESDMVKDFGIAPNMVIYGALIKGLCSAGRVDEAIKLKDEVFSKGFKLDSAIYTALIGSLFKDGRKWEAAKLRTEMELNGFKVGAATYNVMIYGCCMRKEFDAAICFLDEMEKKGLKPDLVNYNVIIRALCGEGKLMDAVGLFEDMPRRKCRPDAVTYKAIIDALGDGYRFEKAVLVLNEMVGKGYVPRSESVNKLVDALIEKQERELLWKVFYSLGEVNGIGFGVWRRVVSMVCAQALSSHTSTLEVVDSLIMAPSSRSQGLKGQF